MARHMEIFVAQFQKLLSKIENISTYKIILPVSFLTRCETGSLTFMEYITKVLKNIQT